ncbi:MAG: 2-oxo acid dehydrogenase subunit E2 [Candidatus Eremiobacteraeota bacterium]|nr:2-oxo acid dehydrogenase subunit E2 [Candidatus Eremiobacteraeota bacterium]
MAAIDVRVPNIGDFADVPIIDVLVAPGDAVAVEDPLVTLESDKATMEVPSAQSGTVKSVAVKVGDKVSEGSVLLTLDAAEAALATGTPQAPSSVPSQTLATAAPAANAPAAATVQQPQNSKNDSAPLATQHAEPNVSVEPASYGAHPSEPAELGGPAGPSASEGAMSENGVVHASPSIRRFARELGVDLSVVHGTGPHERITRDDVQNFVKSALAAPAAARGGNGASFNLPPLPKVDFAKYGPTETIPLSRIRKLSGPNLHRNWMTIPHVTNNEEADVTELEAFRKRINAERNVKTTMLAFAIKVVVAALQSYPDVNSSLDGDNLVLKKYYNVGFAADTPAGLVVPVLRGADTKGVLEIAAETAALAAKAREGKLAASDMSGATFTISSLGGIGGTSFSPIINAPEVAILGISRAAVRPVWDGNAFVPRLMLPLSLSYDHRVIDGALAARFNGRLVALLADLRLILL